jgi:prepilin-type N-terminal cleavage/methylation domain-containing protein
MKTIKALNKKLVGKSSTGFTLIEILVGAFVFAIVALSIYGVYVSILEAVRFSRVKITMAALANEQFEIVRNLSYSDVGIVSGLPPGKIEHSQVIFRDGKSFSVETVVRSIDDPFDGTIGGTPNDLSPADYKFVGLEISCISCKNSQPLSFTTNVGPKNLESASTNGALFVLVFDATGQPVQGADVHIENNKIIPAIAITTLRLIVDSYRL